MVVIFSSDKYNLPLFTSFILKSLLSIAMNCKAFFLFSLLNESILLLKTRPENSLPSDFSCNAIADNCPGESILKVPLPEISPRDNLLNGLFVPIPIISFTPDISNKEPLVLFLFSL